MNTVRKSFDDIFLISFRMVNQIADGGNVRMWLTAQAHGSHTVEFVGHCQYIGAGEPFAAVCIRIHGMSGFDHLGNHGKGIRRNIVRISIRVQQSESFFTVFINRTGFNISDVFSLL